MVHSKVMIVDDGFLRIGSANINNRSMGADTECDLAFEATTEDHRDFFRSLRRGLIGHFCGVERGHHRGQRGRSVWIHRSPCAKRRGQGLAADRLRNGAGRCAMTDIIQPIADPKQPLNLQRTARRMWTARTVLAVAGTAAALTGLALAWRTTSLSDYTDIGYVASFISRHAQSALAPLFAVCVFVLGGLVVFPVIVLIAATAAALGPWIGALSATAGRAREFAAAVHDRPLSRSQAAAIAARRARLARSEPHRRQGRGRGGDDPDGAGGAVLARQRAGRRQPAAADGLPDRHRARHGARHRHHGSAGCADRGLRQECLMVERGAARPDHPALDRGLSRGAVRGDLVERTPHVTETIRIMTWNVHGTFNLNPDFDLEGVSSIIDKWSPDVVALQEVDSRGRTDDVFGRLADAVGEHRVEARSIVTEDGDYGQVLISRWPFAREPDVTDVSYQEREPRRAISAAIRLADRRGDRGGDPSRPQHARALRAGAGARRPGGCAPHRRGRRLQRLVLGQVGSAGAGVALPGADAAADVSVSASGVAARPHLRHAERDHGEGVDRPRGAGLFGPSAGTGGCRVFRRWVSPTKLRLRLVEAAVEGPRRKRLQEAQAPVPRPGAGVPRIGPWRAKTLLFSRAGCGYIALLLHRLTV